MSPRRKSLLVDGMADGRPDVYQRPINPAGNGRQQQVIITRADRLLESLRAAHGDSRQDLPKELDKP